MPSVLIRPLQTAIYNRLAALTELKQAGVRVFSRREKNITTELETALGTVGLAVQVFAPRIARIRPNANGLLADDGLEIRVRISEHPDTNRTLLEIGELQELILYYLHLWTPDLGDQVSTLHAAENPTEEVPHAQLNIMDIFFETTGGFTVRA